MLATLYPWTVVIVLLPRGGTQTDRDFSDEGAALR